jgi:hypothetical protein
MPGSSVEAINFEIAELPSGPVPIEVKMIVTKIPNVVNGEAIEVHMGHGTR